MASTFQALPVPSRTLVPPSQGGSAGSNPVGATTQNDPLTCGNADQGVSRGNGGKGRVGRTWVMRSLDVLPLLLLAGFLAALALPQVTPTVVDPWGSCTEEVAAVVGSPCWSPEPVTVDPYAALEEAAVVADLTAGMVCWDPSEGRVGTHLVVRDAGTDVVSVVPFNDETFAQASAGAFWVTKVCEVA